MEWSCNGLSRPRESLECSADCCVSQTRRMKTGWATESHYESVLTKDRVLICLLFYFLYVLTFMRLYLFFFFYYKNRCYIQFSQSMPPARRTELPVNGKRMDVENHRPVHPSAAASFGIDFNKQKSHLVLKRRGRKAAMKTKSTRGLSESKRAGINH